MNKRPRRNVTISTNDDSTTPLLPLPPLRGRRTTITKNKPPTKSPPKTTTHKSPLKKSSTKTSNKVTNEGKIIKTKKSINSTIKSTTPSTSPRFSQRIKAQKSPTKSSGRGKRSSKQMEEGKVVRQIKITKKNKITEIVNSPQHTEVLQKIAKSSDNNATLKKIAKSVQRASIKSKKDTSKTAKATVKKTTTKSTLKNKKKKKNSTNMTDSSYNSDDVDDDDSEEMDKTPKNRSIITAKKRPRQFIPTDDENSSSVTDDDDEYDDNDDDSEYSDEDVVQIHPCTQINLNNTHNPSSKTTNINNNNNNNTCVLATDLLAKHSSRASPFNVTLRLSTSPTLLYPHSPTLSHCTDPGLEGEMNFHGGVRTRGKDKIDVKCNNTNCPHSYSRPTSSSSTTNTANTDTNSINNTTNTRSTRRNPTRNTNTSNSLNKKHGMNNDDDTDNSDSSHYSTPRTPSSNYSSANATPSSSQQIVTCEHNIVINNDSDASTYTSSFVDSDDEHDLYSDEDGSLVDINNPWVTSISNTFHFRFPTNVADITTHKNPYPPLFAHQICTTSAFIYGYRGLTVEIMFNPTTMHSYVVAGYRSSIFDRDLGYRGRGPRVSVDHLTREQWLYEKRAHVLCDYTYTIDGQIEILGLDQATLQKLLALKSIENDTGNNNNNIRITSTQSNNTSTNNIPSNSSKTDTVVPDDKIIKGSGKGKGKGKGKKAKEIPAQYQMAPNSSIEKSHVAMETIKTRQRVKHAQQQQRSTQRAEKLRTERSEKETKRGNIGKKNETKQHDDVVVDDNNSNVTLCNGDVNPLEHMDKLHILRLQHEQQQHFLPPTPSNSTTSNNTANPPPQQQPLTDSKGTVLTIPQLQQTLSKSEWKKLEALQTQYNKNRSIVAKTTDQLYDEAVEAFTTSAEALQTNDEVVIPLRKKNDNNNSNKKKTISRTTSIVSTTPGIRHPQLPCHELEDNTHFKRVRHQGGEFESEFELPLDDQARIRAFSVGDMPSLESVYYATARHFHPFTLCNSLEEFQATFDDLDSFTPPGELVGTYLDTQLDQRTSRQESSFFIYLGSLADPVVNDYHRRIQPLLLFYIDTASFIDSYDHAWEVLFSFQRVVNYTKTNGISSVQWRLVGFTTLYTFLKFPSSHRLRLSQILVLPSAQRAGHGMKMLETVYALAAKRNSFEVNIEDPSVGMRLLRDTCDIQRALAMGLFPHGIPNSANASGLYQVPNQVYLEPAFAIESSFPLLPVVNPNPTTTSVLPITSPHTGNSIGSRNIPVPNGGLITPLVEGVIDTNGEKVPLVKGRLGPGGCCGMWTPEQIEQAREALCITKLQCERVMECICLSHLNPSDEDSIRDYRLRLKRRFMSSHKDQLSELGLEDRKKELQRLYDNEVQVYSNIHRKLRMK